MSLQPMLPIPVSFGHSHRPFTKVILSRSRLTNLGVLLLTTFTALSTLLNIAFYLSSFSASNQTYLQKHTSTHPWAPLSISSTISRTPAVQVLDHLVIVPGHAIWRGPTSTSRLDEDEWVLEPFQRASGRVAAFIGHINRGVEIASNDERALLVFSGGQTRSTSTTTEAESYLRLAQHLPKGLPLLPDPSKDTAETAQELFLLPRATSEDHALDSFQNLLFSIARFREFTGRFPAHITVVGYEMKRRRFTNLHRAAIRWPEDRFTYVGVDIHGAEEEERAKAHQGEHENGFIPYSNDTYGCHSTLLAKRRTRNPFARYHSYYTSSPELRNLLDWCPGLVEGGTTALFHGPLPWSHS